ncbi:MAG: hypothetical protein R2769_09385 [Saprospiraceae bacterium]
MKAFISSMLILIVLTISWLDLLNITAFYLNQAQLEKYFCENILQPELDCHGKCYLRKTINHDQDQKSKIPLPERSETNISFIFGPDLSFTLSQNEICPQLNEIPQNLHGQLISISLLKPPKLFLA